MAQSRVGIGIVALVVAGLTGAGTALAGFAGTDVFIASVGRNAGAAGSDWYTTVWVYNPNPSAANVQFSFLERDRANLTPLVFNDVVQPGDTARYDNAVDLMFKVQKFGALRVMSDARLVVNSRIYSQTPGGEPKDSVGQFFAGVPASFAIGLGQSTQLLGAYQTAPKTASQFRYNFGFVETSGHAVRVRVTAMTGDGSVAGSKDYDLLAFEPRQFGLDDILPGVDLTNVRLSVQVIAGDGRLIAFGSGLANRSNDPFTAEMQFADGLLAANAPTSVSHDASLVGDGSTGAPLAVADAGILSRHLASGAAVRTLNGAADDVSIVGGGGISVGTAGRTVTIASAASGPCPGCDAGAVVLFPVTAKHRQVTAFTVEAGKTVYLTGIYPNIYCDAPDGYMDIYLDSRIIMTMTPDGPAWSSSGGAPIVVSSGSSVILSPSASAPKCDALVTLTGFQF